MRARAFAKVNLTLEITGKRPDGFHDLVSLFQTISLADELDLQPAESLELECDWPDLVDDSNLVVQAARLLGRGGHFRLTKRIPVASGLGGGSSDAAACLRLLNAVYRLNLSAEDLAQAAAALGSDVPFFLTGGTAIVEGRGERVSPLPDLQRTWLVLLNPGVPLSTASVYRELTKDEYGSGGVTRGYGSYAASVTSSIVPIPPLPPLINTLEPAAERLEPAIASCRDDLREAGAANVLLSGSGPTLFALAADEDEANAIAARCGAMVVHFVSRAEALELSDE